MYPHRLPVRFHGCPTGYAATIGTSLIYLIFLNLFLFGSVKVYVTQLALATAYATASGSRSEMESVIMSVTQLALATP